MSLPQIFEFDNKSVRTIEKDGDVWFVARDVAEILGYANPQKAVRDHCKTASSVGVNDSFSLDPQTTIIPERDIYRLVMRSKLPSAEKFENWVVSEVLPSIRKTGAYTPATTPELQIAQAMLLAGKMIEEQKFQIEQRDKLIATQAPKVAVADRIANTEGLYGFRQVAKLLDVKEPLLRRHLISNDWIYYLGGRITAKAPAIKTGYMDVKIKTIDVAGEDKNVVDAYFTSKGLNKLAEHFNAELQEAA